MTEMTCRQVVELLWEYIDAELTPELTDHIRAHLAACEACYPHYEFQKAFLEFVRRHGVQVAPPTLREKVLSAIARS